MYWRLRESVERTSDADALRALPRGRHGLSREAVRTSQRERLLEAVTRATAEKGFAAVTIGDIVARAATARRTFYEHFQDKEECFLAAFNRYADRLIATITERFDPAVDLATCTAEVLNGFLGHLAANPVHARTYLIEINAVGPAAVACRLEVHRRFAETLVALGRSIHQRRADVAPLTYQHALAVVGAVHELLEQALHDRGAERLPEMSNDLVALTVGLLSADVRLPMAGRTR